MLIALYRWKIKPGYEQQFTDCWSKITLYYLENHGSNGSRLHRGNDGLFYGYAKWPSLEQRNRAFATGVEHPARPGMIVLMHVGANPDDGTTLDAAALPAVIDGLRAKGYSFVTLQQAL